MNNIDESTYKKLDVSEIEEIDKQAERLDGNYQKGTTYADGCRHDNDPYLGGKYNKCSSRKYSEDSKPMRYNKY